MEVKAHSNSDYLCSVEQRFSSELSKLPTKDQAALIELLADISRISIDAKASMRLRCCKDLFSYRWAHARISRSIEYDELGRLQTRLAEVTIDKALQIAWSEKAVQRSLPTNIRGANDIVPGLFVLGLGKLGGYDLNFSSDVDLIAFYDPATLPVLETFGRMDICVKVLKRMTQILSNVENGSFVWRVDWRLRPDASVTQIVMSTEAAQDFYFFRSLPWHRLAMIKARPVAGDLEAGKQFLKELEPYLWRQNLDYGMVDEIFRLKEKINLEHPQLKLSRLSRAQDSSGAASLKEALGFNLKLGAGGIREIEFLVNALQLLWGGKKVAVREKTTLVALRKFSETGLIDSSLSEQLSDAYQYLRRLEDAVQMLENEQAHHLPSSKEGIEVLLGLMNLGSYDSFLNELVKHRENVHAAFSDLFATAEAENIDQADEDLSLIEAPCWLKELEPKAQAIWDAWSAGFSNYAGVSDKARSLKPLFLKLSALLSEQGLDRADAIAKIDQFFRSIPKGGQYLRLLAEHPQLLQDIVEPLLFSPHMRELLSQSPHIVDYLLEPAGFDGFEADSKFVTQSLEFEVRLERLRRFVNEQIYRICLNLMRGRIGSAELQSRMTMLAEHVIGLGLRITDDAMGLNESPIAIVAMGKLGMQAMAPMSDLDLIFVVDDGVDLELANNYSRRFQTLMETKTKEGRAYEMDMRLRPSGRSGPVTVSLSGLRDYHERRAKNWEHIAFVAARPLAGDKALISAINRIRTDVLTRRRDLKQFKLDAAKMLWRLREQRIGKADDGDINIKLRAGGMMEQDYLSACYCLLSPLSQEQCALPYDTMIREIWPDPDDSSIQATRFWRKLQIWSRVIYLDGGALENLPEHLLVHLLEDMECSSILALREKMIEVGSGVKGRLDNLIQDFEREKPDEWKDWQELPVRWVKSD